jgi:hypothetical protein
MFPARVGTPAVADIPASPWQAAQASFAFA